MAIGDVRREITFCRKVGLKILGIIENMSGEYNNWLKFTTFDSDWLIFIILYCDWLTHCYCQDMCVHTAVSAPTYSPVVEVSY